MSDPPVPTGVQAEHRPGLVPRELGQSVYQVRVDDASRSYLTEVLGNASSAPYFDFQTYFKYAGVLTSKARVNGVLESKGSLTQWLVGCRLQNGIIPLANELSPRVASAFRANSRFQVEIERASVRNSAFPTSFKTMDLSAVVERLAMALAKYSMYGTLTCNDIKGAGPWRVRSINAATDNIAIGAGNIFMTRRGADHRHPAMDCAMTAAVSGCGATMYTDLLAIDHQNIPQITTHSGATLASGCLEAVRILGAQFRDCDAGPDFALAFVRGIHKTLTVPGHSDEGAYVRTVLRTTDYCVPYGAILVGGSDICYTGLPTPGGDIASFRMLTHGIALCSAGLSACADPMTPMNGALYPTVLCSDGPTQDPGVPYVRPVIPDLDLRANMQGKWAGACDAWAKNYVNLLCQMLNIPGDTRNAVNVLNFCAGACVGSNDRHLDTPVAMAFCWVEPTGIVPIYDKSMPAYGNDCGPLGYYDIDTVAPAFKGIGNIQNLGMHSTFTLDFRFPRRHAMFVHLERHNRNGLSNFRIMSGSADAFVNVGRDGPMGDRIMAAAPVNTLLWGRMHNQVIGVGELLNTNSLVRFNVEHYAVEDYNAFECTQRHTPDISDMTGDVVYRCVRPTALMEPGGLGDVNHEWSRSRSAAAKAIDISRSRVPLNMRTWGVNVRPVLGEPLGTGPSGALGSDLLLYATRGSEVDLPASGEIVVDRNQVSSRPLDNPVISRAGPLAAVVHNVADRGPRAPRAGRLAGGQQAREPRPPPVYVQEVLPIAAQIYEAQQNVDIARADLAAVDRGDAAAFEAANRRFAEAAVIRGALPPDPGEVMGNLGEPGFDVI